MLFSLPPGLKFSLFPIYSEDKILPYMWISVCKVQKLWTKTSVFNKSTQTNMAYKNWLLQ